MRRLLLFGCIFHFVVSSTSSSPPQQSCSVAELAKCAEPLKTMGVPLSKNLVRLLLQIPTPLQLRKSCQAYSSVMPCFHAQIAKCGSATQREILRQLSNAVHFLCSPFSTLQQSELLANRHCIGRLLSQSWPDGECRTPAEINPGNGTNRAPSRSAFLLHKCREQCLAKSGAARFACMVGTWVSEQNLCLLGKMRQECGRNAAAFYVRMQREIFNAKFPLICSEDSERTDAIGERKQRQKVGNKQLAATPPVPSSTWPSIFVKAKKRRRGGGGAKARLSEVRLKIGGGTKKKAAAANAVTNNGTSFLMEDSRLAKMPGTKGMEVTMVPNGMLMSAAAYAENGALQTSSAPAPVPLVTSRSAESPKRNGHRSNGSNRTWPRLATTSSSTSISPAFAPNTTSAAPSSSPTYSNSKLPQILSSIEKKVIVQKKKNLAHSGGSGTPTKTTEERNKAVRTMNHSLAHPMPFLPYAAAASLASAANINGQQWPNSSPLWLAALQKKQRMHLQPNWVGHQYQYYGQRQLPEEPQPQPVIGSRQIFFEVRPFD